MEAKNKDNKLTFLNESGGPISLTLHERGETPVSRCSLKMRWDGILCNTRNPEGSDLLHVTAAAPGQNSPPHLMPAASNDPAQLMEEVARMGVGRHRVYLRAMNCVRDLL